MNHLNDESIIHNILISYINGVKEQQKDFYGCVPKLTVSAENL